MKIYYDKDKQYIVKRTNGKQLCNYDYMKANKEINYSYLAI